MKATITVYFANKELEMLEAISKSLGIEDGQEITLAQVYANAGALLNRFK